MTAVSCRETVRFLEAEIDDDALNSRREARIPVLQVSMADPWINISSVPLTLS